LHRERPNIDSLAQRIAGDDEAVKLIIDGLTFTVDTYRHNCNNLLVNLARLAPKDVYPYWNHLIGLLESANTYHRCSAINVLPHLIPADQGSKFEREFDRYFSLLDDRSVIPPCYIARNCVTIASHSPGLIPRIIEKLLAIDETNHKQGRKDLIKADIILVLQQLYDETENQQEILGFVEDQLQSSSPKTRKAAKLFLAEHGPV
jgi:hypothetical protein